MGKDAQVHAVWANWALVSNYTQLLNASWRYVFTLTCALTYFDTCSSKQNMHSDVGACTTHARYWHSLW